MLAVYPLSSVTIPPQFALFFFFIFLIVSFFLGIPLAALTRYIQGRLWSRQQWVRHFLFLGIIFVLFFLLFVSYTGFPERLDIIVPLSFLCMLVFGGFYYLVMGAWYLCRRGAAFLSRLRPNTSGVSPTVSDGPAESA